MATKIKFRKKTLLIVFFLLINTYTYACSCIYANKSIIENYNTIDLVFTGRVSSIKNIIIDNENYVETIFTVKENFKKYGNNEIKIYQPKNSECTLAFQLGDEWIVWTDFFKSRYGTSICYPNVKVKDISDETFEILKNIMSINGYKTWYDNNGYKIAEGFLSDNIPSGYWIYYRYGCVYSEGFYDNGVKEGKWITCYDIYPSEFYSQHKEILINIINDKKLNMFRKLNMINRYKKGLKSGLQESYDFSGKLTGSSMYENNQLNGTQIVYENGKTKNIYGYKNNKLDGMWVSFFENGTIELICYYKSGKQKGRWELYDQEGEIVCSSKNRKKFPQYIKGKYYCR